MHRDHVGALVVIEDDRPVGMLTDRDLALRVVAEGAQASSMQVAAIASGPPVLLREDASLQLAVEQIRASGMRRMPVVDEDGRLVGVFAIDDFVRLAARELLALSDVALEQSPAGDRRTVVDASELRQAQHYVKPVTTVERDASVRDAARAMARAHVGCVIVVDDAKPCGIATDRDLAVRVVAEDLDPVETPVSAVMSGSLLCLDAGEPLQRVVDAMSEIGARRIPITRDGALVGIVTYDDVLATLGRELAAVGETAGPGADTARS
jgi:CBS domain-containing protein